MGVVGKVRLANHRPPMTSLQRALMPSFAKLTHSRSRLTSKEGYGTFRF